MFLRAALSIVILLAVPKIAGACVCPGMPPCQKFWMADAVFTGVVTDVTWSGAGTKENYSHTTLVVERGFRGASGQMIVRGHANSSCHYQFTVGQRYFVYAYRDPDGALTVSECSGTKRLTDAEADFDYAEQLPPPGSGGRIYGHLRRTQRDLLDYKNSKEVFSGGITITLRDSSDAAVHLRTNAEGKFEATGLKPDTYSISVGVPATARVNIDPTTIELRDRACVPVGVYVQSNGRIAGRIVDGSGDPVKKAWVSILPAQFTNKTEYPNVDSKGATTDEAGRYEIGPLPAGEYHVGVNINWTPRLELPYAPTYYPGVLTREVRRVHTDWTKWVDLLGAGVLCLAGEQQLGGNRDLAG